MRVLSLPASSKRISIWRSTSAVWLRMSAASHSGTMPARYTTPLKMAASL